MRWRLPPRTALGRAALIVGLVVGFSQALALWFFARNAYLPGIREYAELTVLNAELAIAGGTDSATAERIGVATGITVVDSYRARSPQEPSFLAVPVVDRFRDEVQERLGEPVTVLLEEDRKPILWVNAPSFDGRWLRVPMNFFRDYDRYVLLSWGVTAPLLAWLAGVLIARGLSRPLKQLEHLAASVGRGEQAQMLDDQAGPEEINAVSRAFNQMAIELHQAQQDRALLLAGVSHDLRTPLTRLRLSAEFLQDQEMRDGIIGDVEDMDAILEQFIAFIRDGSDEEPEPESINVLIEEVLSRFDRNVIDARLRDVPRLMLKRLTFKRLITNLVTNALKYGAPPVNILTSVEAGDVVLRVRDHGPGINEQDIPKLLAPFSRGDVARTISGSGLGLAIVGRIVDMHHGVMTLRNHPESGLEVEIRLPVAARYINPEALSRRVR